MRNKVYNVGLGRLPHRFMSRCIGTVFALELTQHAREECFKDTGRVEVPPTVTVSEERVVEMETFKDQVMKLLFRLPYTDEQDLCLVVLPDFARKVGTVKTVYLNHKNDRHETLNINRML
jgi:hypothetical protein